MAEQRASGNLEMKLAGSSAPLVFVLTSIAWREAWKYRDRAYRYCLHDIGTPGKHWRSLPALSDAIPLQSVNFPTTTSRSSVRFCEDEWPMLIVELRGGSIPVHELDTGVTVWFGGQPNQLSKERTVHALIDRIRDITNLSNLAWTRDFHRSTSSRWHRRDQTSSASPINTSVWRGRPNAAFGARLRGWYPVDVPAAALGRPAGTLR